MIVVSAISSIIVVAIGIATGLHFWKVRRIKKKRRGINIKTTKMEIEDHTIIL